MEPPLDRRGKPTLDAPLRLDEDIVYEDNGRTHVERIQQVPRTDDLVPAATALLAAEPPLADSQLHGPVDLNKAGRQMRPKQAQMLLVQRALVRVHEGDRLCDIAEDLGVNLGTLTGWISRHKLKLKVGEIDQRLDQLAVPLAVDNLIHGLLAGDKDYTLETLKGRGKFRKYSNADEVVHHDLPPLRIQFEPPAASAGYSPEQIAMGRVVGCAALPAPATAGEVMDQQVMNAEFSVEQAVQQARKRRERDSDDDDRT